MKLTTLARDFLALLWLSALKWLGTDKDFLLNQRAWMFKHRLVVDIKISRTFFWLTTASGNRSTTFIGVQRETDHVDPTLKVTIFTFLWCSLIVGKV